MKFRQERLKIAPNQTYIFSAWVKVNNLENLMTYASDKSIGVEIDFIDNLGYSVYTLPIAEPTGPIIDGWQKIEFEFRTENPDANRIDLSLINNAYTEVDDRIKVYFDDIRIYPLNASMETYVYDRSNYRLVASLDNNNYATFYGYDDEGALQSTQKETLRGRKTIQEIRAHTAEQK